MHGIVHKSLKEHVETNVVGVDWDDVVEEAGLEPRLYLPVSEYPDEDVLDAVEALAALTGASQDSIQRAFGRHLAPDLIDTFEAHVRSEWGARDLLLSLEVIYEQVAAQTQGVDLPDVSSRTDGDAVVVTYRSGRELCPLASGIVHGVAEYYDRTADVTETACLREGDDRCELSVEIE